MPFDDYIPYNSDTKPVLSDFPVEADMRADSALSLDALESELTTLAGHLNAANFRFLMLLGEFQRREGYAGWGILSCAHWLSWRCGLSLVAARDRCRVARALENLPQLRDAMRRGSISFCKARAITRVATPENEALLLELAEHGTVTHVEKTVRLYRKQQCARELQNYNETQDRRELCCFVDDDGQFILRGRLGAEQGALVRKALEAAAQQLRDAERDSREAGPVPDRPVDATAARNADALGLLAETFLAHDGASLAAGDRHLVTVHVDEQVLRDEQPGRCDLDDVSSIPPATVRRLCCDASLVTIVEDAAGSPLDIGRKTRVVPPAMHRALVARDVGCRFPGCANTRFVDAHHIIHWADGGTTSLDNLILLCRRHHRFVHELGYQIERVPKPAHQPSERATLRFVRPDDQHIPEVPHVAQCTPWQGQQALQSAHVGAALDIDDNTATPRWDGSRPDYGWLVESLCRVESDGERQAHLPTASAS